MKINKLFIDTKIDEFEDELAKFEQESNHFFDFKQHLTRWDCFAKSEAFLRSLHKKVNRPNKIKLIKSELEGVKKTIRPEYDSKVSKS